MPALNYEATRYNLLLHAIDEELGRGMVRAPVEASGARI